MKNYSNDVISKIQAMLDANDFQSIKHFDESLDEFPKKIYSNGATVVLTEGDYYLKFESTYSKEDFAEWKKEGVGKFYGRDWKFRKDAIKNKYAEMSMMVENVGLTMLIRDLSDIEDEDDKVYLTDLTYDGKAYTIIKAFSPAINESYVLPSLLEENRYIEKINVYDNVVDEFETQDIDLTEIADDSECISEKLF